MTADAAKIRAIETLKSLFHHASECGQECGRCEEELCSHMIAAGDLATQALGAQDDLGRGSPGAVEARAESVLSAAEDVPKQLAELAQAAAAQMTEWVALEVADLEADYAEAQEALHRG